MGIFKPKTPHITEKVIAAPDPEEERPEDITDPEALARARERAEEAKRRKDRRKLRIPLALGSGGGSGLSVT